MEAVQAIEVVDDSFVVHLPNGNEEDEQWEDVDSEEEENLFVSTILNYERLYNGMVSRPPVVSINFENYVIDMIDNSTDSKWPCLLSALGKLKLNSKKGVQEGEMIVPKECLKLCNFARKFKCRDCL